MQFFKLVRYVRPPPDERWSLSGLFFFHLGNWSDDGPVQIKRGHFFAGLGLQIYPMQAGLGGSQRFEPLERSIWFLLVSSAFGKKERVDWKYTSSPSRLDLRGGRTHFWQLSERLVTSQPLLRHRLQAAFFCSRKSLSVSSVQPRKRTRVNR